MSQKVNTFPLITELYDDTRVPLQYPGNGAAAAAKQFELSVLLAWLQANLDFGASSGPVSVSTTTVETDHPSIAVSAGRMIAKVIVTGDGSGTFDLGTSSGGNQILDGESFSTTAAVFAIDKYFPSGGTLYFSGFSTAILTVKLVIINLT